MPVYSAPGVYYETVDAGDLPITSFRTDIAGFVGIAERGPIDTPVPIQAWRQFVSWFGSFAPNGFLAYAVRAFFENGGVRCWVVRVASNDPAGGALSSWTLLSSAFGPVWRVRASTEGVWGDALTVSVRERNLTQIASASTNPDGFYSTSSNVSELPRATHVRISQDGTPTVVWKVVSDVDAVLGRIYWVHPKPERRLPYDGPLVGFDPSKPVLIQGVEYAIDVSSSGRLIRFYDRLSLIPESPSYGPSVLAPVNPVIDPMTGQNAPKSPEPIVIEELRNDTAVLDGLVADPTANLALIGGRDGMSSLSVYDFVGEPFGPEDGAAAVAMKRRGLRALEENPEIAILAIPDAQVRPIELNPTRLSKACVADPCVANPPFEPGPAPKPLPESPPIFGKAELFQIQSQMVLQCETKRDRFALLDPPFEASQGSIAGVREALEWRARFDTEFAALHFPWVKVLDPLLATDGTARLIPPSGHVAGAVAATDLAIGVHKAGMDLDQVRHGVLNDAGVNAIRNVGSRGHRVLGARTVCSDTDWRFINVRRLMSMLEKALERALQWVVFEPNGFLTRARVMMSVTIFLLGMHERGAFAGATPEESFYVKCDLENNPQATQDLGELIVEIGIAPSQPFEFVVLRVGRVRDAIEVTQADKRHGFAEVGA
jgi:phage tail sheath protein FI